MATKQTRGTTTRMKQAKQAKARKKSGTSTGKHAPAAKRGILARYPWKEVPNPYLELRT